MMITSRQMDEYNDAVECGFYLYDFPLQYNDEYCDATGECVTFSNRENVHVYNFNTRVLAMYRMEQ